jgi:hypothetical protein
MKKYILSLLASLLLLGGIGNAQEEPFLDPVGFNADGEPLEEIGAKAYQLVTNGDPDKVYEIRFSDGTATTLTPEGLMEIGLCLRTGEGVFSTLEKYYEDRETPEPYRGYLLSAAAGESPFAVVQIAPAETEGDPPVVTLCDGAVLDVEGSCDPMRIPGDYPNGIYPVSSCSEGDPPPPLELELVIRTDTDGDGLFDEEDSCPKSNLTETVVIDQCDSGVANKLFEDGCTISDRIAACGNEAENHGEFVSCVTHFTNGLKPQVLSGTQKGAIQSCAAQSSIGGLPCESCGDDASGLGQNRHRARYEMAENDLVIPCVEIGDGQYVAVDMNLTSATSKNFHFKVKKAEMMTQAEMDGIHDPEDTCAHYDLLSNSLLFPSLEIGEKQWRVQMKLLGANSVNLHFKLEAITEVE